MLRTGLEVVTLFLSCGCKLICDIDTGNFWRTIERHKVNALFTAPTALRAIKRLDPEGMLYRFLYSICGCMCCIAIVCDSTYIATPIFIYSYYDAYVAYTLH